MEGLGKSKLLKEKIFGIVLMLLLISIATLAFNIQPVKASGTIYIRADGSIDPPTAPITSLDNITYTFTDNINDSIVVERSNIIIDGNGYTLQGNGSGSGFSLYTINNVTIQNTNIKGFYYGIYFNSTSYNVIHGNNITNNYHGVWLSNSAYNRISENNIRYNDGGIKLSESSNNVISGNDLISNEYKGGIWLYYCVNNSILNNNLISNTNRGIGLDYCSNNNVSGNDIRNNIYGSALNLWQSFGNTMNGNNIAANYGYGIGLHSSSNNTLRTNSMSGNSPNFGVSGEALLDFVNDVDVSNTVEGKPIYYWVSKQDLVVPLNAGYIALVNCTRITVQDLSLTIDNLQGVLMANTTNSAITKNKITNGFIGVHLLQSSNNTISGNNLTNLGYGICFSSSLNNIISGNNITNSEHGGIQIDESSNYNSIVGNNIVVSGSNGIYLGHFSDNNIVSRNNIANHSYYGGITLWSSSNNIIIENSITNNKYSGISLSNSSNNIFYHNNFINNTRQVYEWSQEYPEIPPSINRWDDGYPSGGNYWSDYNGTDLHWGSGQDEAGSDGIGDAVYEIDADNRDRYPLMGPFSSFNTSVGYSVDVVSNSTIEDFEFFESNNTIRMVVSNMTANQTYGFCRLTIPHTLIAPPYNITVNNKPVEYTTIFENETLSIIYFSYEHSTLEIIIIPEFPSAIILLLVMPPSAIAIVFTKKKAAKTRNQKPKPSNPFF